MRTTAKVLRRFGLPSPDARQLRGKYVLMRSTLESSIGGGDDAGDTLQAVQQHEFVPGDKRRHRARVGAN
jgi:hypothetical protein